MSSRIEPSIKPSMDNVDGIKVSGGVRSGELAAVAESILVDLDNFHVAHLQMENAWLRARLDAVWRGRGDVAGVDATRAFGA